MSNTRDYIIEKAAQLFLTNSYEAVSISDISNVIGLTKGALYHHFRNKEELFKAVVNKCNLSRGIEFDLENGTLLEFTETCLTTLANILEKLCANAQGFEVINYMSLMADSFRHYPGFSEMKIEFMQNETAKIKNILDNAIKRGEIRSDIDSQVIAQIYFSNLLGLATPIIKNQSIEDAVEMQKRQLNQMYLLLRK